MKKILSVLLSLLLLCQPIVFAETVTENVALNKAAFSYNSAEGTAPYLALDGNPDTYWEALGSGSLGGLGDSFVIDLGAEYSLSSIKINPFAPASAQNIVIWGANAIDNTTMADDIRNYVSDEESAKPYKDWNREKLGETGTGDIEGSLSLDVSGNFRYVILEQKAGTTVTMAFSEIEVYGTAVDSMSEVSSAPVALLSAGKPVQGFGTASSYKFDTTGLYVDGNPSTGGFGYGNSSNTTSDGKGGQLMVVDLGESIPISHVAYQAVAVHSAADAYYSRTVAEFQIVGSNDLTNFTELAYAGLPAVGTIGSDKNTGMQIYPIDTDGESYRYIGIRRVASAQATAWYTQINTFQVYAHSSEVEKYVESKGKAYIVNSEEAEIEDLCLNYRTEILNGGRTGSILGLFSGSAGNSTAKAYGEGEIPIAGSYTDFEIYADTENALSYKWSGVIVDPSERIILDYISDLNDFTRPSLTCGGTASGTASYKRAINELQLSGEVDAGIVAMVILKPGADFLNYTKDDIFDFDIKTAPDGNSGAWSYTFSNLMTGAEVGTYTVCFFSDTGALTDVEITHEVVDVDEVAEVFDSATADTLMDIFTEKDYEAIQSLFDKSLIDALAAADEASGTVGKSFLLAKEGFEDGVFADNEGWSDMDIISKAIQTAILVDNTLSGTDIADSVASYGDTMPLVFAKTNNAKYYNADEFEEILPSVISEIKPDTAEELALSYERAIALSLIANGELSERKTAIELYADVLGIEEETLDTDHSLRAIADELSKSMSTVKSSYAGGMDSVIEDIIDDLDDNSGGGSGGRVLGGNKTGAKAETPAYTAPAVPAPVVQEQTPEADISFYDIADYAWAKDAIELLAGRRIMEGPGDGSFNPSGLLTREQAVKLLVLTLNMDTNQNTNSFKDLQYGAWYYPYITSAKMSGLVTGISRTEFGLGQLVTRQDLAVMIYRALDARKLAASGEGIAFEDDAYVADYAKEAVASLGSMKLITGYTDGRFGPADTATRAEAAAVFARLLEIVENEEAAQ